MKYKYLLLVLLLVFSSFVSADWVRTSSSNFTSGSTTVVNNLYICNASQCNTSSSSGGFGNVSGISFNVSGFTTQLNINNSDGSKLSASFIDQTSVGGDDLNNYTTQITVTGVSTKNITLVRVGMPNISATFTDEQGGGSGTVTQIDSGLWIDFVSITTSGVIGVNASAVVSNIGNWSSDKPSYLTISNNNVQELSINNSIALKESIVNVNTKINNNVSLLYPLSNPFGFYNSSTIPSFALISYVDSLGNWSADKPNYLTISNNNAQELVINNTIGTKVSNSTDVNFNKINGTGLIHQISNVFFNNNFLGVGMTSTDDSLAVKGDIAIYNQSGVETIKLDDVQGLVNITNPTGGFVTYNGAKIGSNSTCSFLVYDNNGVVRLAICN